MENRPLDPDPLQQHSTAGQGSGPGPARPLRARWASSTSVRDVDVGIDDRGHGAHGGLASKRIRASEVCRSQLWPSRALSRLDKVHMHTYHTHPWNPASR